MKLFSTLVAAITLLTLLYVEPSRAADTSPHRTIFVTVAPGVRLEVLDWGGSGSPIVFLAGLSSTAHNLDSLARSFTGEHHVYAITRRGVGLSTALPADPSNYDADQLADDVLSVLHQLKIEKPILIGHSFAGVEMSSIGTRYPNKVAGLVYMDAAYPRAFYEPSVPLTYEVDAAVVSRDLRRFQWASPKEALTLLNEIQRTLPNLQRGLDWYAKTLKGLPDFNAYPDHFAIAHATLGGDRKYTAVKSPMLIFFAVPKSCQPNCKNNEDLWQAAEELQRKAIERSYVGARIVRLQNADHSIWLTNKSDVVRNINSFAQSLGR
jgi:non-heme chloroperoxidase